MKSKIVLSFALLLGVMVGGGKMVLAESLTAPIATLACAGNNPYVTFTWTGTPDSYKNRYTLTITHQTSGKGWQQVVTEKAADTRKSFVDFSNGSRLTLEPGGVYKATVYANAAYSPETVFGVPFCRAITDLRVTSTKYTDKVRLSWSNVGRGLVYDVYRGISADKLERIATNQTRAGYDDKTGVAGVSYQYQVAAVNPNSKNFRMSNMITAIRALAGPTRLSASDGREVGKVILKWTAISNLPSGFRYDVYRTPSGEQNWGYLASVSEPSFADTTVSAGAKYRYRVFATGQIDGKTVYSLNSNDDTGYSKRQP